MTPDPKDKTSDTNGSTSSIVHVILSRGPRPRYGLSVLSDLVFFHTRLPPFSPLRVLPLSERLPTT